MSIKLDKIYLNNNGDVMEGNQTTVNETNLQNKRILVNKMEAKKIFDEFIFNTDICMPFDSDRDLDIIFDNAKKAYMVRLKFNTNTNFETLKNKIMHEFFSDDYLMDIGALICFKCNSEYKLSDISSFMSIMLEITSEDSSCIFSAYIDNSIDEIEIEVMMAVTYKSDI